MRRTSLTSARHAPPVVSDNTGVVWQSLDPTGRYDQCARWLMTIPDEVEKATGRELLSYTVKKTADGWLLTIKARKHKKDEVAFLSGNTPFECFFTLAIALGQRGGLKWRKSLY